MNIMVYSVDLTKYSNCSHNYLLTTTEYTCGNTILAKQVVHKTLNAKIALRIADKNRANLMSENETYYISKTYLNECRQIKHSTFIAKFSEFKESETYIVQEFYEEFSYGDAETIGINIIVGINASAQAYIEFNSISQQEAFVLPEWLINVM